MKINNRKITMITDEITAMQQKEKVIITVVAIRNLCPIIQ